MKIFSSKQRILKSTEIHNVIVNHMSIEQVTYFKCLGVIIDSNLKCRKTFVSKYIHCETVLYTNHLY